MKRCINERRLSALYDVNVLGIRAVTDSLCNSIIFMLRHGATAANC